MSYVALLLALAGCDRLFLLQDVDPLPTIPDGPGLDVFVGDAPVCAGMFGAATSVAVGAGPAAVAVGDLNGDGLPDLVAANSADSTLTFVLGKTPRTFGFSSRLDAASGVVDVAIADVNLDTRADIIDIGETSGTVQVYLGSTNGFAAPVESMTNVGPKGLRVARLNADNYPDLVVAHFGAPEEKVFFGAALQSQATTFVIPTNKVGASSVDAADIDHDGDVDLVFANHEEDNVAIARNIGNGTFQAVSNHQTKLGPNWITLADVTGDGYADIITADNTSGTITISPNDGTGHFLDFSNAAIIVPAGSMPWAVDHADFDLDGNQDLVVSSAAAGANTVAVMFGDGNGGFPRTKKHTVGATPHGLVAKDVDGDGLADIVVANYDDNTVSVLFNCP